LVASGGKLNPVNSRVSNVILRSFYARDAVTVARGLLGKLLVHGETSGIIIETEAYLGTDDLAAHSVVGITGRTKVIFGEPGHAYVYLNYGIHECLNIVAEPEGIPGCVLIRALKPVDGIEVMRERRKHAKDLAGGPGKLTQALAITRALNGADVTSGPLTIRDLGRNPEIQITKRIGIAKSAELPLRFLALS
jgi:DNA-3-methyladenine glycosylase